MAAAESGWDAASGAGALRALASQLDACLLQLFLELEQLEGKRTALNARVEEGWFSLSKTRYALGAKAVSPLQYGSSMNPLFRVRTSEPEPGRPEFQVICTRPGAPRDLRTEEVEVLTDCGDPEPFFPPGLRRRPQLQGAPPQPTPPTAATGACPERDPLTWFGILVPQSLRQAQGSFRAALQMAGEIAELQSRIKWGRAQIQSLQHERQKLLDQLEMT
ncbi:coiled-coil domain-containing protein 115-like [Macrotis lagotis]|uniref:coiled-coil domain-containing protein 115-like n=1 Tax=Macrotis lagotis TaxID=92651 RepID=UPI003D69BE79